MPLPVLLTAAAAATIVVVAAEATDGHSGARVVSISSIQDITN